MSKRCGISENGTTQRTDSLVNPEEGAGFRLHLISKGHLLSFLRLRHTCFIFLHHLLKPGQLLPPRRSCPRGLEPPPSPTLDLLCGEIESCHARRQGDSNANSSGCPSSRLNYLSAMCRIFRCRSGSRGLRVSVESSPH